MAQAGNYMLFWDCQISTSNGAGFSISPYVAGGAIDTGGANPPGNNYLVQAAGSQFFTCSANTTMRMWISSVNGAVITIQKMHYTIMRMPN